jgi:hypothetical protein
VLCQIGLIFVDIKDEVHCQRLCISYFNVNTLNCDLVTEMQGDCFGLRPRNDRLLAMTIASLRSQ